MATSILEDVQREQDIYELAIDIARQIFPLPTLLLKYKITEAELEQLHKNPIFTEIIKQATTEWNAAGNTHKRTKLKAAILVESTLGTLYDAMTSSRENLGDRIKALDIVAKIAGLNSTEGSGGPIGSTFKLSINFNPGNGEGESITLGVGLSDDQSEPELASGEPLKNQSLEDRSLKMDEPESESKFTKDEQLKRVEEISKQPETPTISELELQPISSRFAGVEAEDI